VVVATAAKRPARLRWLEAALAAQTRPADAVLVVDDAQLGAGPGGARNAGWRAAPPDVDLVAFTDDDCRPAPDWLERLVAAAQAHPGAVVQGATRPDPDEAHLLAAAPHARTQDVAPPNAWVQAGNVAYPRALLERVGGFDAALGWGGEDTDLWLRARAAGAELVAAPDAVVHHAVHDRTLPEAVRDAWRWRGVAAVVRRHPSLRRRLVLGVFWHPSHAFLTLAALTGPLGPRGALTALHERRDPRALVHVAAVAGWAVATAPRYGLGSRGLLRSATELPGRLCVDLAEMAAALAGALRHRTPFL
jgi:hypothetical protein